MGCGGSLASHFQATSRQLKPTGWKNWGEDKNGFWQQADHKLPRSPGCSLSQSKLRESRPERPPAHSTLTSSHTATS